MNKETQSRHTTPHKQGRVKDPVCGMWVEPDQQALTYLQMHFAFCSTQCKQRFQANPHLYIGRSGHKAPVQEGQSALKQRRLKLSEALPDTLNEHAKKAIAGMMGIEHIRIEGDTIDIQYDLLQITETQIESVLAEVGATLDERWSQRLRRAFVHCLEETEISSLEVPASGHGHHH